MCSHSRNNFFPTKRAKTILFFNCISVYTVAVFIVSHKHYSIFSITKTLYNKNSTVKTIVVYPWSMCLSI